MLVRMEGRGRPSYYNIGDEPGASGMIRRNSRSDAAPPYQRVRANSAPRIAASSPMSNLSALERGVHPTGSPIVGSPVASPNPLGTVLPPPPGLPAFGGVSPVQVPPQTTVESVLLHTVQQQQSQVAQLTSLVQTLVSRESVVRTEKGKGVGDLSDITDSSNRAMEVDEGAPIRNPKAEAYVPKLPVIDGARMGKGRRSEIEGWADFFEQFLPWIALFDDRIPEELHRAIATETTVKQSALDKGQSVRSTRTFLYLKQAMQNFSRGVDIIRQVEKEQLGSPAGYECVRRLHQELSVGSRIEASTLRTEILQFKSSTPSDHPLDCFRNVQLEMSRFARLTQGFPDLALSEADKCMVILRNLDNDIKRYVLLHARIDSLDQLETAIKFFDSNLKILQFSEKSSRKGDHANPLQWKENKGKDGKGKGKDKDEKGKGKDKEKHHKDDKNKGKEGKGKSGKDGKDNKGKGGAAKDKGKGNPGNKGDNKDKEKEERLKNIKCYNCDQYGHYSNKCPKPKREKASAAPLLEPQVAAVSLEPQLFAVALECPVVALDAEDSCSELSDEDWGGFVSAYESSWLDPEVALEGGEPVVVLGDSGVAPVELEDITVELAEPLEFSHRIPVELAEPIEFSHRIPVELGCCHEEGRCSHEHGMVAHETALASTQQHAMDWWLVDSGASAHIVNEETLQRLHVVSISDSASECISATGDSIGVRRSAMVRVPFVLVSGETVVTELQVLIAPVKFNLLSLGRLLGKSWLVEFLPKFRVQAGSYLLRSRWVTNCGWVMSRSVECLSVAQSQSSLRRDCSVAASKSVVAYPSFARVSQNGPQEPGRQLQQQRGAGVAVGWEEPPGESGRDVVNQGGSRLRGFPCGGHGNLDDRDGEGQQCHPHPCGQGQGKGAARGGESQGNSCSTEGRRADHPEEGEGKGREDCRRGGSVGQGSRGGPEEEEEGARAHGEQQGARHEEGSRSLGEQQGARHEEDAEPTECEGHAGAKGVAGKVAPCAQGVFEASPPGSAGPGVSPGSGKEAAGQEAGVSGSDHCAGYAEGCWSFPPGGTSPQDLGGAFSRAPGQGHGSGGRSFCRDDSVGGGARAEHASTRQAVAGEGFQGGTSLEGSSSSSGKGEEGPHRGARLLVSSATFGSATSAVADPTKGAYHSGDKGHAKVPEECSGNTVREELVCGQQPKGNSGGRDRGHCLQRGRFGQPGVDAARIEGRPSSSTDVTRIQGRRSSSTADPLCHLEKFAFAVHGEHGELDVHAELGEHGVHVELGEHGVLDELGVVDQEPSRQDQDEAWLLRGDKDHLREESWGRLEREHVLRSHIPYNSSCPHCIRGRGLEPARTQKKEQDSGMREVQIDKFFYKGFAFLVLVLVGAFALGVVPYREVSGARGPAAKEAMLNDMSAWSRSVGLVGVGSSELTVSVKSDVEGVVRNLAQSFADGLTAGAVEVVDAPVGRHAVVAERAVRTLKETANTLCAGLEQVGLEPTGKGVTYLLVHCAQVYNRYQVHPGSALSPQQRCLKTTRGPHAAYVWGAAVLATPPPSLRDKITGRYGHASYLGPEVGSGSHIVQFRLRDGSLKIARAARVRMLVPLTFELSSLKGLCRLLPGRADDAQRKLPEVEGENVRDLPLPNTATRGPPPEWIAENGRTPRCRACRLRGLPADKAWHTQQCRERYAEFIRNSFNPNRAILDQAPIEEEQGAGGDIGHNFDDDLGFDLPEDVEPHFDLSNEDLAEYEPSEPEVENEVLPGHDGDRGLVPAPGELDFIEVEREPLEALPEGERDALMSSVMYLESVSFAGAATQAVTPECVELGGEKLLVEVPVCAKDDVTGQLLDIGLTYQGMLRELRALESLAVGDVIWHVDPKQRVISTRWVSNAKVERVEGKENPLVRCRVVARDFAQGATAAQLGISAATSSAEALRTFLFYAGSKRQNIVGLDVSTAFLFAELDEDGEVVVKLPDGVVGSSSGRRGYLRLKKALYGLRVAAQTWSRHLAKLLKKLCNLEPCETEPCLFSGTVLDGQRVAVLCYVDDLLITGESDEAIYHVVEQLKSSVKIKVTADLDRDHQITFLGRQIIREHSSDSLCVTMSASYYDEIYNGFFGKAKVTGNPTPPNLKELYDREEEVLQRSLTSEAAARFRSTLGRLSWLAMTRVDIVYYVSMLARGQATPLEKHERAMRSVLRYLKHIQGFQQVVVPTSENNLRLDCYVAASWGSEKNVDRKSISGGCIMIGGFCLKAWSRLQQAVALSSAESELYGLVEGAKEALAIRRAISHVFGWSELPKPTIFCDSESAIAISKADGLRKVRHIDLRACFIQDQIKQKQIFVYGVRGEANIADLFTKPLSWVVTLKHMWGLGLRDVATASSVLGGFVELCGAVLVGEHHVSLHDRYRALPFARWLVVEFCAPLVSTMREACEGLNWVNVLTVSERDDGASSATIAELKAILSAHVRKKGFVFLWSSTPCTGGCPYQRLHARSLTYRRGRLAQHWRLHRRLWKAFVELSGCVHAWAIEWPRSCAYWSWRQTQSFLASRPYTLHDVPVDGCALEMRGRDHLLIAKRWRVVTTHATVAEHICVYRCSRKHEHSKDFDLKQTQHYPTQLVKSFLAALRR